ncbi:MAG: sulfatase-like hydrolase/transferase [Lewinellaceae bacterium]|nr:sulfatase-like hydrolase/transferase [Lewinellaceae bacterium]
MKRLHSSRRIWWFLAVIPVVGFLWWPLSNDRWTIPVDEDALARKEAFLAAPLAPDTLSRPNIVLILADDLGKMDISLYGDIPIKTARIDALGQEGVRFEEGYITSPICAPSRAALLTGRYQQRFGFEYQPHDRYPKNRLEYYVYKWFLDTPEWQVADEDFRYPGKAELHKQGLPPSEITLAELLQKAGYATGIIGKWHLGYDPPSLPNLMGFDYHYGFYEAFSLYADPADPGIVNQRNPDFSDPHIWRKGRTGACAIRINDQVVEDTAYLTNRLADEAIGFIEKHKAQPFFLYVPFSAPHTPFQAERRFYDRFTSIEDPRKRVYFSMIASLDEAVGRILDKLKAEGLDTNTLVFFLSDNGGATYTQATTNAPLKGGKFTEFEGGVQVPFFFSWPGHTPSGMAFSQPVSAVDIFATVASAARVPLPGDRPMDGVDLMPYLQAEEERPPHPAIYWRSGFQKAIRKGPWKLLHDELSGNGVLYYMNCDPYETTSLWEQRPEERDSLMTDMSGWEKELQPPLWPRVMNFRFRDGDRDFFFPL